MLYMLLILHTYNDNRSAESSHVSKIPLVPHLSLVDAAVSSVQFLCQHSLLCQEGQLSTLPGGQGDVIAVDPCDGELVSFQEESE